VCSKRDLFTNRWKVLAVGISPIMSR
jgi:hypothetical protein